MGCTLKDLKGNEKILKTFVSLNSDKKKILCKMKLILHLVM